MNWRPTPKNWSEFIPECLWYLMPEGILHVAIFFLSAVLFGMMWRCGVRGLPRFGSIALFQVHLLWIAMIMNGIWSCAIWARLYWTVDYTSDFSPFRPISSNLIHYSWGEKMTGGLNGISLLTLNAVWLIFALFTWILAALLTRFTLTRIHKKRMHTSSHWPAGHQDRRQGASESSTLTPDVRA